MHEDIQRQLNSLARDDCYRVDAVLKEGELERTERVFFVGANGSEQGPYVRKRFDGESGLGNAYRRILEAQRAGERFLHLPRIIDCYGVGEFDVVVMEYVQGRTLAEEVYACDPSLELAARVFPQACEAVRELHERFDPPLIHRDIKPSNLMVSGSSVLIIDLGIARTYDAAADSDTMHFGTRAYAPPEQFGYGQTDERSDVYALGMLLFYLLTEQTPQVGKLDAALAGRDVPQPVRDVVAQAAAFDPKARFRSAAALEAAFAAAVGAGPRAGSRGALRMGEARQGGEPAPRQRAAQPEAGGEPVAPQPASTPLAAAAAATVPEAASKAADDAPIAEHELTQSPVASDSRKPNAVSFAAQRPGDVRSRLRRLVDGPRKLLARVPVGVGIAWDTAVVLYLALFAFMCASSTVHPVGDMALLPGWACDLGYACVWVMFASIFALVFDLRPFRRFLPGDGHVRFRTRLVWFAVSFLAATIVLCLIGNLMLKNA